METCLLSAVCFIKTLREHVICFAALLIYAQVVLLSHFWQSNYSKFQTELWKLHY